VTDAWFGHAVLCRERPFHPLGPPASSDPGAETYGLDLTARPAFAEIAEVRADRMAQVRAFVAGLAGDDLERPRGPNPAPGYPEPAARPALDCLRIILNEERTHRRLALRDLPALAG